MIQVQEYLRDLGREVKIEMGDWNKVEELEQSYQLENVYEKTWWK